MIRVSLTKYVYSITETFNLICLFGREGYRCDQCVPLPGCDHGNCSKAFECNCYTGWDGSKCDIGELKRFKDY